MSKTLITPGKVNQLAKLFRDAVGKANITDDAAQWIGEHGGEFQEALIPVLRKFAKGAAEQPIFELVETVVLPALSELRPCDRWSKLLSETELEYCSSQYSLSELLGRVEKAVDATALRSLRLRKSVKFSDLLPLLGGVEAMAISLGQLLTLLERQAEGQQGCLVVKRFLDNVVLVRDAWGRLLYVLPYFDCFGEQWSVSFHSVPDEVDLQRLRIEGRGVRVITR